MALSSMSRRITLSLETAADRGIPNSIVPALCSPSTPSSAERRSIAGHHSMSASILPECSDSMARSTVSSETYSMPAS